MSSIYQATAREHTADLLRAAEESRYGRSGSRAAHSPLLGAQPSADAPLSAQPSTVAPLSAQPSTVALRLAQPDEARVVRRLAAMDDAPVPEGETLLALIDGEAVAALSLTDGRVVANPLLRTADAVALLRVRAEHLRGARRRRPWWRPSLRPRFA